MVEENVFVNPFKFSPPQVEPRVQEVIYKTPKMKPKKKSPVTETKTRRWQRE